VHKQVAYFRGPAFKMGIIPHYSVMDTTSKSDDYDTLRVIASWHRRCYTRTPG
jgi:hypothetical protein